jgi:nitrous oxidase accessory protein NosD
MQLRKKLTIFSLTLIFLGFSIIPLLISSVSNGEKDAKYLIGESGPLIIISGDADLLVYPGNGSMGNPYIIGDLVIDGGDEYSCIDISSTTKYLTIENCTFVNSGEGHDIAGIAVIGCRNIEIRNCTFSTDFFGILIGFSNHVKVIDCIFEDCTGAACETYTSSNVCFNSSRFDDLFKGLYLLDTDNVSIVDNTFTNIADAIYASGDCINVTNNSVGFVEYGLKLGYGNDLRVCNNSFHDITWTSIQTNDVDQMVLLDNVAMNQTAGFMSTNGRRLEIYNNTFQHSIGSALVFRNTSESLVVDNAFSFNLNYGVILCQYSSNNTFSRNLFVCNGKSHVESDAGLSNQWNDTTAGNYWDDYELKHPSASLAANTWSEPYQILAQNIDYFPLYVNTTPSFWLEFTISQTTCSFYIRGCFGNAPTDIEWDVDGTGYRDVFTLSIPLTPGLHRVNVRVEDVDGEENHATLSIIVAAPELDPYGELLSDLSVAINILLVAFGVVVGFCITLALIRRRRCS